MRVLLLGNSRIGRKRIIPALRLVLPDSKLSIASLSTPIGDRVDPFQWFDSYEVALSDSGADLVYISLPNSLHEEWAEKALLRGCHVVVDKPAFLTLSTARRLVDLATRRRQLLAEATVFQYHPQWSEVTKLLQLRNGQHRVVTAFSFPELAPSDFRYQTELGGGALLDLGPYVAATDRVVFGDLPKRLHVEVGRRLQNGLIAEFSVMLVHDQGTMIAQLGFGTQYQNWLRVFNQVHAIDMKRAFTMEAHAEAVLEVTEAGHSQPVIVSASDSFAGFLSRVVDAIRANDSSDFAAHLIHDATIRDAIATAASNSLTEH
jgi:NDP-hexose-3-ketoreductase